MVNFQDYGRDAFKIGAFAGVNYLCGNDPKAAAVYMASSVVLSKIYRAVTPKNYLPGTNSNIGAISIIAESFLTDYAADSIARKFGYAYEFNANTALLKVGFELDRYIKLNKNWNIFKKFLASRAILNQYGPRLDRFQF